MPAVLLTRNEVARRMRISIRTVDTLIKAPDGLRPTRIGVKVFVLETEVAAFLRRRSPGAAKHLPLQSIADGIPDSVDRVAA